MSMSDSTVTPESWGLTLDVYVRSYVSEQPLGGDLTASCGRLTLVGVVDHRRRTRWTSEQTEQLLETPANSWLPSDFWQARSDRQSAPGVWLVKDRWTDGERYLIPARDDDGLPDPRYGTWGGHFAASTDQRFWQLLDSPFFGAVAVFDKRYP